MLDWYNSDIIDPGDNIWSTAFSTALPLPQFIEFVIKNPMYNTIGIYIDKYILVLVLGVVIDSFSIVVFFVSNFVFGVVLSLVADVALYLLNK